MAYCTRQNISTHEELLGVIITFKEIFCFIFRSAGNPKVEIMVYDPNKAESHLFEINTRYQRNTTDVIKQKYADLLSGMDFFNEFDNIAEVSLDAKGTVRGKHTIYSNPDTPWDYHSMLESGNYHNML